MKKKLKTCFLIIGLITFFSCEQNETPTYLAQESLLGYWGNIQSNDSIYKFQRSDTFSENTPGISFLADQRFVERSNSGDCGTPPIYYANFNGNWSIKDSIINISVKFWGGTVDYQWKLISVDATTLTIVSQKTDFHFE
jgi:hypothetical protein